MRRRPGLLPLALLLGVMVCRADELRIAIPVFPANLNPVYATDETSQLVVNKIYHSLFTFDGAGELVPEAAAELPPAAAARRIRLRLKRGLRFSDGRELQAADVAATFALLRDSRYAYPYRSDLAPIAALTARGADTVEIELAEPLAAWPGLLTFKILSAAEIAHGKPETFRQSTPCGSGPYRLAGVRRPLSLELTPNPAQAPPRFRRLVLSVLPDLRSAPLKLLTGEIDAAELQPEDSQAYRSNPSWQRAFSLHRFSKFGFTYLMFNLRRPNPDTAQRRFIYNRLVCSPFLERFLQGRGERVNSPFLPISASMRPQAHPGPAPAPPPEFTLLVNSESRFRRNLALFICAELRQCGIACRPLFCEYHTFLARLKEGRFDAALSGFVLDPEPNLKEMFFRGAHFNYSGYADAGMEELIGRAWREMDRGRRMELYRRAHRLWWDHLPFIPLFNLYYYIGMTGAVPSSARGLGRVASTCDFFYRVAAW